MILTFIWPSIERQFTLSTSNTSDNALAFNALTGDATFHALPALANEVMFYYGNMGLMILNGSQDLVCVVNNELLDSGAKSRLSFGTNIQIGNFGLYFDARERDQSLSIIDALSESMSFDYGYDNVDVNELLPQGAGLISDELEFQKNKSDIDVLKKLELEYKNFLLWGSTGAEDLNTYTKSDSIVAYDDGYFDSVRDEMKGRLVTECIFESSAFMDLVWNELSTVEDVDLTQDEYDNYDILKALAPSGIVPRENDSIPFLVSKELHKLGLDSPL